MSDPRWKPVFNAVCDRLPWERSADERRLAHNLCRTEGDALATCLPCEMRCATGSPERQMVAVAAGAFLVVVLLMLMR